MLSDHPFLTLRMISVMTKKRAIQLMVAMKPQYTSGSVIAQPLVSMDRSDVVARVRGRNNAMQRRTIGIPSIGQMTPLRRRVGQKEPRASWIAFLSSSQMADMTKPKHMPQRPGKKSFGINKVSLQNLEEVVLAGFMSTFSRSKRKRDDDKQAHVQKEDR